MLVSCLRLQLADQQPNWNLINQPLTYAYNHQPHHSTNISPFSLSRTQHLRGPANVDIPTVVPTDSITFTTPNDLRLRLLAKLATISPTLFRNLRQSQTRYEKSFDKKIRAMPKFSFCQLVLVDHPPLVTLSTNIYADRYSGIPLRACGLCLILQITEQTHTMDENNISDIISIDRATPLAGRLIHATQGGQRLLLGDNVTLNETNTLPALRRPSLTTLTVETTSTEVQTDCNVEIRLDPLLYKESNKDTGDKFPLTELSHTFNNDTRQNALRRRDHYPETKRGKEIFGRRIRLLYGDRLENENAKPLQQL